MNRASIGKLLEMRELRVELSLNQLSQARSECTKCERKVQLVTEELEALMRRRLQMQQARATSGDTADAWHLIQIDQRIHFLAEQGETVAGRLVAANKALAEANKVLQVAVRVYTKACAKRDSLLECQRVERRREHASQARASGAETEELVMFNFYRTH